MKEKQQFIADMVELANRVWNNGDFMAFEELYAPDVVYQHPGIDRVEGSQGLAEYIRDLRAQYPDLVLTFEEMIFEGDKLVCHWRFKGTDKGIHAASDLPPTGNKVDFYGADVMHLRDGKIAEDFVYFDQMAVMQQLGLVEPFGA